MSIHAYWLVARKNLERVQIDISGNLRKVFRDSYVLPIVFRYFIYRLPVEAVNRYSFSFEREAFTGVLDPEDSSSAE